MRVVANLPEKAILSSLYIHVPDVPDALNPSRRHIATLQACRPRPLPRKIHSIWQQCPPLAQKNPSDVAPKCPYKDARLTTVGAARAGQGDSKGAENDTQGTSPVFLSSVLS